MESKQCKKCGKRKSLSEYHKHAATADRRQGRCKECEKLEKRDPRTKEEKAAHMAQYCARPGVRDGRLAKQKEWRQKNKAKLRAKCAPEKLKRTPSWANEQLIAAYYKEAKRLQELTGIEFVDHIIPLQGDLVSGLHVENNFF